MGKIVAAFLFGFFMLHIMLTPAKAASTTKTSCTKPQFQL